MTTQSRDHDVLEGVHDARRSPEHNEVRLGVHLRADIPHGDAHTPNEGERSSGAQQIAAHAVENLQNFSESVATHVVLPTHETPRTGLTLSFADGAKPSPVAPAPSSASWRRAAPARYRRQKKLEATARYADTRCVSCNGLLRVRRDLRTVYCEKCGLRQSNPLHASALPAPAMQSVQEEA